MTWIGDGCQGDRRYECTYQAWEDPSETWCIDTDELCYNWDDGGRFLHSVDHEADSGGGW